MSEFQTRPVYFHTGDLQHFHAVPRKARKGRQALYKIVCCPFGLARLSIPLSLSCQAQPTSSEHHLSFPSLAIESSSTTRRDGLADWTETAAVLLLLLQPASGGGAIIPRGTYLGPLTARYDTVCLSLSSSGRLDQRPGILLTRRRSKRRTKQTMPAIISFSC